ncbi:MAG: 50S ribosomal protein L29 [Chloroflexi bacterium]|nr:50S ribosomal protein L29 [Chloroflexota bacterium]
MAGTRKLAEKLRELSDEDMAKELEETYRELFTVRLQLATRQQANTSVPKRVRRRIARIKTLQREREVAAVAQAATEAES